MHVSAKTKQKIPKMFEQNASLVDILSVLNT